MKIFSLWEEDEVTAKKLHWHSDNMESLGIKPPTIFAVRHSQHSTMLSGFSMKQFHSLSVNLTNIIKPQHSVFSSGTYQHCNNVF